MGIPQIIILTIIGISLLTTANQHGKESSKVNFWIGLLDALILIGLLVWGGFFG